MKLTSRTLQSRSGVRNKREVQDTYFLMCPHCSCKVALVRGLVALVLDRKLIVAFLAGPMDTAARE